jgi:hypothetical protein
MSRAGRRREYATARAVGPAANPNFPVWARRRLLKRNKLGAAHDPTLPGDRDLVSPLTIIVAAAPLPGRISVATAIDPRIMSKRLRSLRNHPNERDPKQQDPVCNLIWTYCHRTPPQCRPRAALPLLSTVRALASDCLWADAMLRPRVAQAIKIRSSAPMAVLLFLRSLALRGLYRRYLRLR